MKGKIITFLVMTLLIATSINVTGYMKDNEKNFKPLDINQFIPRGDWFEEQKLLASDGEEDDWFGFSVSISGDTALIGAVAEDNDNGFNAGSAHVYIYTGDTWSFQAKLVASNGAANDWFGHSVSLDEDTALIGAKGDDDNADGAGAAYVFTRSGSTWSQQAKLVASDGAENDWFGHSVSLDGNSALIGAPTSENNQGSAYVFTRSGSTWSQQAKLVASDGADDDYFGESVSIYGDTALIGACYYNYIEKITSAYVFIRTGSTWTEQQKLQASDGEEGDQFGCSVALYSDTVLIGADWDNINDDNTGSAFVFTRSGSTWTEQAKLVASDGGHSDHFGWSVSLDDDTAFIGAHSHDYKGAGYVFTRTGGSWTEQEKLLASDGDQGDAFGITVSLDGDTALIGAAHDEDNGYQSGSAYIFKKEIENSPPVLGTPSPLNESVGNYHNQIWGIPINDTEGDTFSWSIECSNGQTNSAVNDVDGIKSLSLEGLSQLGIYKVWVNATDPEGSGLYTRQWFVFAVGEITWDQTQKLPDSGIDDYDFFGYSVSVDGDTAFVGAIWDSDWKELAGSVFVYTRNGYTWTEETAFAGYYEYETFGTSVSLNGNRAIIGAPRIADRGSAYIFAKNDDVWSKEDKLVPSDSISGDQFGYSVSLDGDTALIGAPGTSCAYVFTRTGSTWIEQAKLSSPTGAGFGYSVSLDGDTALIGAPGDDIWMGSAYVFTRSGSTWTEQAKLVASEWEQGDEFGFSVALDGNNALIGAPSQYVSRIGKVYSFTKTESNWEQHQKLIPSDTLWNTFFGSSVSLEGNNALIGAPNSGSNTPPVYMFTYIGNSWQQHQKIFPHHYDEGEDIGRSVSLSGDTAFIGATWDDYHGQNAGAVYTFVKYGDFEIVGFCPIDLSVSDDGGRYINKDGSNIPGATYIEEDLDGDGDLDDKIYIPDAIEGMYQIEAIPEPDAEPTDTYTLRTTFSGASYYLAEDVMVQDIPPEGYGISWPDKPSQPDGPSNCKVGETYTYTSSTTDPDGDDIMYLFDWGDGTDSSWIETGEATHKWTEKDTYEVKVKAKDTHDFESDWSDPLSVTMPRNIISINTFLMRLFERFPNLFPIIRQILNL